MPIIKIKGDRIPSAKTAIAESGLEKLRWYGRKSAIALSGKRRSQNID